MLQTIIMGIHYVFFIPFFDNLDRMIAYKIGMCLYIFGLVKVLTMIVQWCLVDSKYIVDSLGGWMKFWMAVILLFAQKRTVKFIEYS